MQLSRMKAMRRGAELTQEAVGKRWERFRGESLPSKVAHR